MQEDEKLTLKETYIVEQLDSEQRLSDFVPGKFKSITSKKGMKKQNRIDFALRSPDIFETPKIFSEKNWRFINSIIG